MQAVAYGAIGALPSTLRARLSAQYEAGNLARLTEVMTGWSRGLKLGDAEIAERFFGRAANDPIVKLLRGAAVDASLATDHAGLREASEKVAEAAQAIGLDRLPRFLADAQDRARDPATVAAVEESGQIVKSFVDHVSRSCATDRLTERSSRISGVLLASTIFSTPHYIGRVGAENIPSVEGTARGIIEAPGFAPGSSCCFIDGGNRYEMRTHALPNGDLNVGTIFPIE